MVGSASSGFDEARGNPLRAPRQAILAQGAAAVKQFLASRLPEAAAAAPEKMPDAEKPSKAGGKGKAGDKAKAEKALAH